MSSVISLHLDKADGSNPTAKYRFLELPPELCKLIESSPSELQLSIKGKEGDDAVLCTENKTYALRSVTVSNSMVVVTGSKSSPASNDVYLSEDIHEIMELVPIVPKLDRINGMLRGSEYREEDAMEEDETYDNSQESKRYTREDLFAVVQASDTEFANALRERHILEIDDYLRPLSTEYLGKILVYIFTSLVSYGLPRNDIPAARLMEIIQQEHDIPAVVTRQVMQWFGTIDAGKWDMDSLEAVKHVGLGLLRPYIHEAIKYPEFIFQWRNAVGDAFSHHVDVKIIQGHYLLLADSGGDVVPTIRYFSRNDLPTDPLSRFNELFLTRSKWREEEVVAFLEDIAVDKKDRDRLLLKFARRSTGSDGVVYFTARAGYV
ncbi:hypothetical protein CPB86DRAFT_725555 [Serendipita vermifera]|nr:hypothetical protein CPB86DRAFT_725555 [Serendipita vermifera]